MRLAKPLPWSSTGPVTTGAAQPRADAPGGAARASAAPTTRLPPAAPAVADWPEPARRALAAHARALGLSFTQASSLATLARAEVEATRAAGHELTLAEMMAACARAQRASQLTPAGRVLTGFSRLTDNKLVLEASTLAALARDAAASATTHPSRAALMEKLLAQLAKQGESEQMQVSRQDAQWIADAVVAQGGAVTPAMGGAGGFAANLGAALSPQLRVTFYSPDALTPELGRGFGARVRFLDERGAMVTRQARVRDDGVGRVNTIAEYRAGTALPGGGTTGGTGRVILSTPARETAGFGGATDEGLRRAAREHDLVFLAGVHYLTVGDSAAVQAAAGELARQLRLMRAAAPDVLLHHQYVKPKDAANEATMLAALRGAFDSMSLNTVEVGALLGRLADAQMTTWRGARDAERDVVESPAYALEAAAALAQACSLSRVHLHGLLGDLLVVRGRVDAEQLVLGALRARQVAEMKTTNASGQIRDARHLWPLMPIVEGRCLAAVREFADAVAARFGLDAAARAQVVRDWYFRDPATDTTYIFAPSRGIHDFTGGTVSLGDTIDFTTLVAGDLASRRAAGRASPRAVRTPQHPSRVA